MARSQVLLHLDELDSRGHVERLRHNLRGRLRGKVESRRLARIIAWAPRR